MKRSPVVTCLLLCCFSLGVEEADGPLWCEELRRADSELVVDRVGEVRAGTRRGFVAWTNQRSCSVPAAHWHQGNAFWLYAVIFYSAFLFPHYLKLSQSETLYCTSTHLDFSNFRYRRPSVVNKSEMCWASARRVAQLTLVFRLEPCDGPLKSFTNQVGKKLTIGMFNMLDINRWIETDCPKLHSGFGSGFRLNTSKHMRLMQC